MSSFRQSFLIVCAQLGITLGVSVVSADDWPMWRCDAARSGASDHRLPSDLEPLWVRNLERRQQAWDDPLNLDLMTFDRSFEPIVMGSRLFVGFNDSDKLVAFDTRSGKRLWSYFAEAPVRLPPVGWNGAVYFCSDDGFLYCVDADDGSLKWRFDGAPSCQHALGNRRLTSAWPARGGPVIRDGTVYFAASIWPFMGTFIYALDAETGQVEWVNDSTGSQYIKQPHGAPSFAGVAPQGSLVATEEFLVVPGGRSVPAVFGRAKGDFRHFEINAGGKGIGGSFVIANDTHYFVHTREKGVRAFRNSDGTKTGFEPNEPVLDGDLIYSAEKKGDHQVVRAYGKDHKLVWEATADGNGDLIKAGAHLYAAGNGTITVLGLRTDGKKPTRDNVIETSGDVVRMIAGDRKLFTVSAGGTITAYGESGGKASQTHVASPSNLDVDSDAEKAIREITKVGESNGYALWFGASDQKLIDALAAQSSFSQLAVIDNDKVRVNEMRRRYDNAGLYGKVTIHHSDPREFKAPPFVAHQLVVGSKLTRTMDADLIQTLFQSVRPYGGVLHLLENEDRSRLNTFVKSLNLEKAHVETVKYGVLVRRVGSLPGAASWTHQYGNVANTIKSNDERVKLPLGVLWFGGSSNTDVLPRHSHGPPEQVVGGRLYIQGLNSLSARDVYTGRVLWKREFESLGTSDVFYDATYKDAPLNPAYNQVHIPGANGRGTNFVVTKERVYILEKDVCHVLDPISGETITDITLPKDPEGQLKEWGYIGVYKDVLIGGLGFAMFRKKDGLEFVGDKKLTGNKAGFASKSLDRAASAGIVVFDRYSGNLLWTAQANQSFWHNGIVAGEDKIFCLDKYPKQVEDALRRRGKAKPENYRIVAFNYRTGEHAWELKENIFGTWLGYSDQQGVLLQAGAAASDRLRGEVGVGMAVYSASTGELKWENKKLKYSGPCILHNEWIITNANSYTKSAGAFRLDDGQQRLVTNPLTGERTPWRLERAYGCNSIIASENLLTFRSGAAGFYDLKSDSGTGNLGGFRAGCTSNLVAADGVLNAPDYTRTCSCSYQNQTSLALVHMPDIETWTVHSVAATTTADSNVTELNINFGAPGDRLDNDGSLWLEYPLVAGGSPDLDIEVYGRDEDKVRYLRHHPSSMRHTDHGWVLASGLVGANDIRIQLKMIDKFALPNGLPVRRSTDDAEENHKGDVDLESSDLKLVENKGSQIVGLRFRDIKLTSEADIKQAYIQFTADEVTEGKASLQIHSELHPNSAPFKKAKNNLSERTRSRNQVRWNPAEWAKTGDSKAAQKSSDISSLVKEVISQPNWKPGNPMTFLISGSGNRVAVASRGSIKGTPKLVVVNHGGTYRESPKEAPQSYQVSLLFGHPPVSGLEPSVFDVYLQDKRVLENLRLDAQADSPTTHVSHSFHNIMLADELRIRLVPIDGEPVLSGVRIVRTKKKQ